MVTKLVIGIGNPDPPAERAGGSVNKYQNTRHNVGFVFLDYLSKKLQADKFEFDKKSNSFISKTKMGSSALILAKPQTYVNKSGESAAKLKNFFKIKPEDTIVVQDDLDIPFGNIKVSFNKNSGGHKGIESVMKALKTKKFYRLRIGLGTRALAKARTLSDGRRDEFIRNYVLSRFTPSEKERLKKTFRDGYEKLLVIR